MISNKKVLQAFRNYRMSTVFIFFFAFYFLNQNLALFKSVDQESVVELTECQEETEGQEEKEKEKEIEEDTDKFTYSHMYGSAKTTTRMDSEFSSFAFQEWHLQTVETPPPELI